MSFALAATSHRQVCKKKLSFCILVGTCFHTILTYISQSPYHGVTKVPNNTSIPKTTTNRIKCIGACRTPLHTNPMDSGCEK